MASTVRAQGVLRYLRHATDGVARRGMTDAELLERFVKHRDEAAFELLTWRHGGMTSHSYRSICGTIVNDTTCRRTALC